MYLKISYPQIWYSQLLLLPSFRSLEAMLLKRYISKLETLLLQTSNMRTYGTYHNLPRYPDMFILTLVRCYFAKHLLCFLVGRASKHPALAEALHSRPRSRDCVAAMRPAKCLSGLFSLAIVPWDDLIQVWKLWQIGSSMIFDREPC